MEALEVGVGAISVRPQKGCWDCDQQSEDLSDRPSLMDKVVRREGSGHPSTSELGILGGWNC